MESHVCITIWNHQGKKKVGLMDSLENESLSCTWKSSESWRGMFISLGALYSREAAQSMIDIEDFREAP